MCRGRCTRRRTRIECRLFDRQVSIGRERRRQLMRDSNAVIEALHQSVGRQIVAALCVPFAVSQLLASECPECTY